MKPGSDPNFPITSYRPYFFFQEGQNFFGNLSRHRFPFRLRDVIHEEEISAFLMQRQGIDVDHVLFINQIL